MWGLAAGLSGALEELQVQGLGRSCSILLRDSDRKKPRPLSLSRQAIDLWLSPEALSPKRP